MRLLDLIQPHKSGRHFYYWVMLVIALFPIAQIIEAVAKLWAVM